MPKLVATALLAGGLLATTGYGLTQGSGDGPPAPAAKALPPAKANEAKVPEVPRTAMTEQSIRTALAQPIGSTPIEGLLNRR